jgi:hypothetical protein
MVDRLTTVNVGDDGLPWADAVLPAQFYGERKGPVSDDPLHRLMRAVLADAIHCFQMGFDTRQPVKRRLFAEAWSWIFGNEVRIPLAS